MKRVSSEVSRDWLRALSIVGPLAGLAALFPVRLYAEHLWSARGADLVVGVLMLFGVIAFSTTFLGLLARQDERLAAQREELAARQGTEQRLRAQMEALHQAALVITSTDTTPDILQHLVNLARDLIGARYGALGILDPQGAGDQFYTSGLDRKGTEHLDPLPQGPGMLRSTLTNGKVRPVIQIGEYPDAAGLPPECPSMRALLAAPVITGGRIVGKLSLTDRVDGLSFSEEDERLLTQLAGHVAAIVHQACLAEEVRILAATAERERLRTTLHDNVIQRVFAIRLELEGTDEEVPECAVDAHAGIEHAIDQLGLVMEEIRLVIVGRGGTQADGFDGAEDSGGSAC